MVLTRQQGGLLRQYPNFGVGNQGVRGWMDPWIRNYRIASAAATALGAAALVGQTGYSSYQYLKGNSTMPAGGRKYRAPLSRRRRFAGRSKGRFAKKRVGKRRGRRYTSRRARVNKALNTNFGRNDVKSLRLVQSLGEIDVAEGAPLANNQRFVCHLDHWTTRWSRVIEAYEEFKFKDIQFVITPRTVATGSFKAQVLPNDIKYLALRTVNPTAAAFGNITVEKVRETPGFRFIPLQRKARTIQNVNPSLEADTTVTNESGGMTSITRHMKLPWMKVETVTKALDVAAIEVVRPGLATLNGDSFKYDVSVYATLMLRGNNDELIIPY